MNSLLGSENLLDCENTDSSTTYAESEAGSFADPINLHVSQRRLWVSRVELFGADDDTSRNGVVITTNLNHITDLHNFPLPGFATEQGFTTLFTTLFPRSKQQTKRLSQFSLSHLSNLPATYIQYQIRKQKSSKIGEGKTLKTSGYLTTVGADPTIDDFAKPLKALGA